jgi:endonuclease G
MRYQLTVLIILACLTTRGQDPDLDFSRIDDSSQDLVHLLSMFAYSGFPQNQNANDELIILINHGFALGFSSEMNQPRWAIYPLSRVREGVNYDRSQYFIDDARLPRENQVGIEGYGGGYDRGHMVPNAAIRDQYGRLAQMETFLMSNICPQTDGLNRGMWADFEETIRDDYAQNPTTNGENSQNIWVIVGPIFPDDPEFIDRPNGTQVAIPESYYAIVVDPHNYPYERPGNTNFLALVFDQDVNQGDNYNDDMIVSINEIEFVTGLNFFPEFTRYYEDRIENSRANSIWKR